MGLAIFLGLIYLSLSICISAYCKRRVTSIGGGLFLLFWGMILGSIFLGAVLGSGYTMTDVMTGDIPGWFWDEALFNPVDLNQWAVMKAFGIDSINMMGFQMDFPEFMSTEVLLLVHFIWFIIPLILGYFLFKRRDI